MKFLRALVVLMALCCSPAALARMPVEIQAEAHDAVGQRLLAALEQEIRHSPTLELMAPGPGDRMRVHLLTIDGFDTAGQATSFAMVLTFARGQAGPSLYLNAVHGVCGATKAASCAAELAREVAGVSEQFLQAVALPDSVSQPRP